MKLVLTGPFRDDYRALSPALKQRVERTFHRLLADHRHPSLRAKKMQPKRSGIYEVRVLGSHRMTFRVDGDKIVVRRVGTHDVRRP